MKAHKKLCWNCDGYVHVYELQCPYCGVDLTEYKEETDQILTEEDSPDPGVNLEEEVFSPPFDDLSEDQKEMALESAGDWDAGLPEIREKDIENPLASLLLLLPGSLFFLFGLALFLFSQDGLLIFKFNSRYWFVYLLSSWPLLYLGWRSLFPSKDKRSNSEGEEEPLTTCLNKD